MKKPLLILAILLPAFAQAQYENGSNLGSVIAFIVAIIVFVIIFIALRQVMIWYWKVDIVIKNQEKLNSLLEEQITAQKKHFNYMENNIYSIKEVIQSKP